MHDINLIPQKIDERKTGRSIFTFIVIIGICGIIVFHGYQPYIQWRQLKDYRNSQTKIIGRYDKTNEDFARLSEELANLEQKREGMSGIMGDENKWSSILSEIERGIPPSTVLTSMVHNTGSLTIEGGCPTDIEAAQLAIYLQNTGLFENVKIDSIIEDISHRRSIFVINCSFVRNTDVENTDQDMSVEEGEG